MAPSLVPAGASPRENPVELNVNGLSVPSGVLSSAGPLEFLSAIISTCGMRL